MFLGGNPLMMATAGGLRPQDVFASKTYSGNGGSQLIPTGVNLTKTGGLSIAQSTAGDQAGFLDTARSNGSSVLFSDSTAGDSTGWPISITSSGLNVTSVCGFLNGSGSTFVNRSFCRSPKFFDIVTWTGNGSSQTLNHNLGIKPGMIIVKRRNSTADWCVYHTSTGNYAYLLLDSTAAVAGTSGSPTLLWNTTDPTATTFSVGNNAYVNASGGTYIAYLFAHDPSTTGIVQCGGFTLDSSGSAKTVTLGWQPQFIILKCSTGTGGQLETNWNVLDAQRGLSTSSSTESYLQLNTSGAEGLTGIAQLTSTGFILTGANNLPSQSYVYLAIRAPM